MSPLNYRMRIYKILFFFAAVVMLASCKQGRPDGILSPKQMVPLLVDVHIVDGSLSNVPAMPDSLFKHGVSRYDKLFKAHGADSVQFRKSFAWYANEPDQLYDIYVKVSDIIKAKADSSLKARAKTDSLLQVKQNKLLAERAKRVADSVRKAEKRKADSIRKKAKTDSTVKKPVKPKLL